MIDFWVIIKRFDWNDEIIILQTIFGELNSFLIIYITYYLADCVIIIVDQLESNLDIIYIFLVLINMEIHVRTIIRALH
jgi:hypothetical protein